VKLSFEAQHFEPLSGDFNTLIAVVDAYIFSTMFGKLFSITADARPNLQHTLASPEVEPSELTDVWFYTIASFTDFLIKLRGT
jgi:hypothetical protein